MDTCVVASNNISLNDSLESVAIATIISFLFISLIKIASILFPSRKLAVFLEIETSDVINNLLFILFFFSLISFFQTDSSSKVFKHIVESIYGDNIDNILKIYNFNESACLYQNSYNILLSTLSEIVKQKETAVWAWSVYNLISSFYVQEMGPQYAFSYGFMPMGIIQGIGGSYSPDIAAKASFFSSIIRNIDYTLELSLSFVSLNLIIISFMLSQTGFFLLTLGFIFRMIPPLKSVGTSLASVFIAFILFFPILLLGEFVVMVAYQEPFSIGNVGDEMKIKDFKVSLEGAAGRGAILGFETLRKIPIYVDNNGSIKISKIGINVVDEEIFNLRSFINYASSLAVYGSVAMLLNFLFVIVIVNSVMYFLGEKESILDFFLINWS